MESARAVLLERKLLNEILVLSGYQVRCAHCREKMCDAKLSAKIKEIKRSILRYILISIGNLHSTCYFIISLCIFVLNYCIFLNPCARGNVDLCMIDPCDDSEFACNTQLV